MSTTNLNNHILTAVAAKIEQRKQRKCIDFQELIRTTHFSKQEIQCMYRGFKQECPSGTVNEDTFKEIYEKFFPYGNVTRYAHHVFKAFDVTATGSISFKDMLVSLSTLLHGSLYQKLSWTFRLYDLNGDGTITKTEMANVVVAVYELLGIECATLENFNSCLNLSYLPNNKEGVNIDITGVNMLVPPLSCTEMDITTLMGKVDLVFARLDTNKDGLLTEEEFIQGCLQDPEILQSLENFQFNIL